MPRAFFASCSEIAAHDFVRSAVMATPNEALRDSEMLPRRELERSVMYRRLRDLGMPLEHVMSAMLHVDDEWTSGVSLFRSTSPSFSERDRQLLQNSCPPCGAR